MGAIRKIRLSIGLIRSDAILRVGMRVRGNATVLGVRSGYEDVHHDLLVGLASFSTWESVNEDASPFTV